MGLAERSVIPFPLSMAHQHMHVMLLVVEERVTGGHRGTRCARTTPFGGGGGGGVVSGASPFIDVQGMLHGVCDPGPSPSTPISVVQQRVYL